MTVYAKWTARTYTVTFDPDMGGLDSGTLPITYDAALPNLTDDIAHSDFGGYRFAGYWDADGTQWYDSEGNPMNNAAGEPLTWNRAEEDTVLTARWTYDVYFNTNTDDPASVYFLNAASQTSEVVPLSAGLDVAYASAGSDSYGNQYFTGKEGDRERAKVTAWRGAPIMLPVAAKRSGYDATQDWGVTESAAYSERIMLKDSSDFTAAALSKSVTPVDGEATIHAIWDVNPEGSEGHAKIYYVTLVDHTKYLQNDEALDAKDVKLASPALLNAKYDTTLISSVNLRGSSVKAPTAADGLVFDGYFTALDEKGVASGTQLTGGVDEDGNVKANDVPWRIVPVKQDDGSWVDEVSGERITVKTVDGKDCVVLYAAWSLPVRNIEFEENLEGLDLDLAPIEDVTINVTKLSEPLDASHVLSDPAGNYTFAGWFDHPVYGTPYYAADGTPVDPDATWPSHINTKLYAHWTYELQIMQNLGAHVATDHAVLSEDHDIMTDEPAAVTFEERTMVVDDDERKLFATTLTKGQKVTLYDPTEYNTTAKVAELATRFRTSGEGDDAKTEKTGYDFAGYANTVTGDARYTATVDFSELNVGGVSTIYMRWVPQQTSLKFVDTWEHDGAVLDPAKLTEEGGRAGTHTKNPGVAYDSRLVAFAEDDLPYIPGFTFDGYYVHRDDKTEVRYVLKDGAPDAAWAETAETVARDTSGAVTLYAHYAPKTYKIEAELHGGTGKTPATVNVTYKQEMAEGPFLPKRQGYDFAGWYLLCKDAAEPGHTFPCEKCVKFYDENGENTSAGCQKIWNIDGNGTLHAAWTPKTYTVNWNYNYDGAPSTIYTTTNQDYDAPLAVPATNPKRPGFGFDGWYTTKTSGGTEMVSGQNFAPSGDAMTVTYYARWGDPQNYSITLMAGIGGYFLGDEPDQYRIDGTGKGATDIDIDITPAKGTTGSRDPWKVQEKLSEYGAYTFAGWEEVASDEDGFVPISEEALWRNTIPAHTEGHHVLMAKWDVNSFTAAFYAYDPTLEEGDANYDLNERFREDATMVGAGRDDYGSSLEWTYAAAEKDGTDLPYDEVTEAPVPYVQGYRFLGWQKLEGGELGEPDAYLAINPQAPCDAVYVAKFAPLTYTIHFFVSEDEQEDSVKTVAYDTTFDLPGIASRTSLSRSTVDEDANTVTTYDGFAYEGWWDVVLHSDSTIAYHDDWKPGETVLLNDVINAKGIRLYAEDGDPDAPIDEKTHLNLYAFHQHHYSFTVPLRASIMVAVDNPEAPVQVFSGAISTASNDGPYHVESIICDPVEGEGHTDNANPGTAYVFTDELARAQAANTKLTLRRADAADDAAVSIPLGSTSTLARESLVGFAFDKGEGNELQLEYGLVFPEGMTAVDFKSHLPKEGDLSVSYPIARLYYTIGFGR